MPLASDMPPEMVVPPEVRRWNWGGFFLTWIWGCFNNVFISLLAFIPIVSIAMPFVLGAMGNEWAWKNKTWESVEQFHRVQRRWAIAGLSIQAVVVLFFAVGIYAVWNVYEHNDVTRGVMKEVRGNHDAIDVLGEPITKGFITSGTLDVENSSGKADLNIPVSGPKQSGTIHVVAEKHGDWVVKTLQLICPGHESPPMRLESAGYVLKP